MPNIEIIRDKYELLKKIMDERTRRLWVATEAKAIGWGGCISGSNSYRVVTKHSFKSGGVEWRPKGEPEDVRVYDFKDKELGKAIPYGVYDVTTNQGWVSVGKDHDTAEFACETISRWWNKIGAHNYTNATDLLIMAEMVAAYDYGK